LSKHPIVVGDSNFNGDGIPDLAVTHTGGISILLGNGDGTFKIGAQYTTEDRRRLHPLCSAEDFTGDGKVDVGERRRNLPERHELHGRR
jgi:hypothetical protein